MTALMYDAAGAAMIGRQARRGLTAEILPNLEAAEAVWRHLEAKPDCLHTPYQRFDWIANFVRATGDTATARVAVLRDDDGRVRILLPLVVEREHGVAVAHSFGGTHANFHMPLFSARDAAALPPAEVFAALIRAGRAAGIDAYALRHQPRMWEGAANPLAASGQRQASDAYGLVLGPDPEATARRVFSADARKKLRSKERRLIEAKGAITYGRAETPEEIARVLAAFHRQKAERFAGMGIPNPYAPESVRRFLEAAAMGPAPAIEFHVLRLTESDRILAIFGGAVSRDRFSGMMTSFDGDPELGRFSPGDLLLHHLVKDQTARGRRGFDLGVGEARYKASICDVTIELVETMVPVSLRGRAYALAQVAFIRARRRVKRDPRLSALLTLMRRVRQVKRWLRGQSRHPRPEA